jgi:hypothetical protein
MTTALDLALSVSLSSYANLPPVQAEPVVTRQNLVKVERTKKGRTIKAQPAAAEPAPRSEPKAAAPSPNGKAASPKLPAAGTIGAKAFLLMMRGAKSRDEKISAIAAFVGYDGRQDFAAQEMAATAKAKGQICPVKADGPSREEIRSAQRSAQGYVAGMPNNQRKLVQDLLGRENLAVHTRNDHVRDARDHKRSMSARKLSIGLARLEAERLIQIRADLARFVG